MQSRIGATIVAALTLVLFALAVQFLPEFSAFTAILLNVGIGVLGLVVLDKVVLRTTDTCTEIVEKRNVAYALVILAYSLIVSASIASAATVPTGPPHLVRAAADADRGVHEATGRNDGPDVDAYLASVGLRGTRAPYCAAAVSYWLRSAAWPVDARGRAVRTASARSFLRAVPTATAADVQAGHVRPEPGSLAVWRHGESWQGHIEVVLSDDLVERRGLAWYGRCGRTVGANTSSGNAGSQRDGGGVYRRSRCIERYAYFRITDFVLFPSPDAASRT